MLKGIEKQLPKGYKNLKEDVFYLLEKAKLQAYKAVDNIRVQTYWQIGERIAREEMKDGRADYGKKVVSLLLRSCVKNKIFHARSEKYFKAPLQYFI